MKVIRDTPEQLIIENRPVLLAILISLFALSFVAAGLFTMPQEPFVGAALASGGLVIGVVFNMAFTRRTQLILDRSKASVELRRRSWFGYSRMTWELQYLREALVQSSATDNTKTYRAALVIAGGMDPGVHPLTLVYSSGSGAKRAESAINRWLDSSRPTA